MNIVYFSKDNRLIFGNSVNKKSRLTGVWRIKREGWFTGPMELLCRKYDGRPERCLKVSVSGKKAKFVSLEGKPAYEATIETGNKLP